jgi:hypothetical protein
MGGMLVYLVSELTDRTTVLSRRMETVLGYNGQYSLFFFFLTKRWCFAYGH